MYFVLLCSHNCWLWSCCILIFLCLTTVAVHITVNNTVTIKILTDSWLGSPGPCPNNHVWDLGWMLVKYLKTIGQILDHYQLITNWPLFSSWLLFDYNVYSAGWFINTFVVFVLYTDRVYPCSAHDPILFICMMQVLAIKTRELSSVQSDCSAKSSHLENKHAQELAAEREKALQVEEFSQNQIIAPFVKSFFWKVCWLYCLKSTQNPNDVFFYFKWCQHIHVVLLYVDLLSV